MPRPAAHDLGCGMKALAWVLRYPNRAQHVWAVTNTYVITITDHEGDAGQAFITAFDSVEQAHEHCVENVENAAIHDAVLAQLPVEVPISEIASRELIGQTNGWWIGAPHLYQTLLDVL